MPVGEDAKVVCLIKDSQEVQSITTRDGKSMKLKKIVLCDPQERLEVEVSAWNETSEDHFEMFPYVLKGIQIKEFRGNKSFTLKKTYQCRVLKQHPYRKYIKDI